MYSARIATFFALLLVAGTIAACSSAPTTDGTNGTSSGDTKSGDTKSGNKSGDTKSGETNPTDPAPSKSSGQDLRGICMKDGDCGSNLCVFKGGSPRGVCTKQCNSISDCPGGFTQWDDCAEVGNVTGMVCIPKT